MRVFREILTTKERAERLLFAADALTLIAAVGFASGIARSGTALTDGALLLAWALIPRAVASFLAWSGRPSDSFRLLLVSAVIVTFGAVLAFGGWDLLWQSVPAESRPRAETAVVMIVAWASFYFVCVPIGYVFSDTMCFVTITLGLLERREGAAVWLPLFLLGILTSATTRRLVTDVFGRSRKPRINLQNARVVTIATTVAALLIFSVVSYTLAALDDGAPSEPAGFLSRTWGARRHPPGYTPTRPDRSTPMGSRSATEGAARTLGYTTRLRLSELQAPRHDYERVLAARLIDEDGHELPEAPVDWLPATFLWRGMSFSTFDPSSSSWIDRHEYRDETWPASGRVDRDAPDVNVAEVRVEVIVLKAVFEHFVAPYFATSIGPVLPTGPDRRYLESEHGDVVPVDPPLSVGSRYQFALKPWVATLSKLPQEPVRGRHTDPRYLVIPDAGAVDVDLEKLAADIGLDRGFIHERVSRLRAYVESEFKYHNERYWEGGAHRLGHFLTVEKTGDCVYFATSSALLLRAGGVSTRVVVGFSGSTPDPIRRTRAYVHNNTAHSWVEVFLPRHGWYPIDPTTWAEPHRDYHPQGQVQPNLPVEFDELDPVRGDLDSERPDFSGAGRDEARAAGRDRSRWQGRSVRPNEARGNEDDALDEGDDVFAIRYRPRSSTEGSWLAALRPDAAPGGGVGSRPTMTRARARRRDRQSSTERSETLRVVVYALASVACGLFIVAQFRSRKRDEDEESDEDDDAIDDDPFSALEESVSLATGTPRDRLLVTYHDLHVDLARARNHRRSHETPVEHGDRFAGQREDLDRSLETLHESVYRTLYGEQTPDEDDLGRAVDDCRRIRRHLG